ncbi:MAG: cell division ATP-binding protein FtsE [Thermoleophilia bacterium]|nr:cell division ATP-binding protein FtsE [Thermoleophilia bacterium]
MTTKDPRPVADAGEAHPTDDRDGPMSSDDTHPEAPAPTPPPAAWSRWDRKSMLRPGPGPMVVLEDVRKVYPGDVVGLDGVSLTIDAGEFVFLVGPSGSGKSTFIRMLIKELDPTSGRLTVGGRDLTTLRRSRVPYLRRAIGCVFQDYKLLPNRSAYDNIAYAMQVTGSSPRVIRRKVPEILSLVGLADKADRLPSELSGGEQQRVSIARAFVNHPRLLIADEPTGNLDPDTSVGIMQLLYRINRTGTTVIVATHDRDMVDRMQMRVIALEGGHLVRDQRHARYVAVDG